MAGMSTHHCADILRLPPKRIPHAIHKVPHPILILPQQVARPKIDVPFLDHVSYYLLFRGGIITKVPCKRSPLRYHLQELAGLVGANRYARPIAFPDGLLRVLIQLDCDQGTTVHKAEEGAGFAYRAYAVRS
jgi:hypothetical protein